MIPTETERPAKLAWHKSTRIKKKELQSDFTQDFGLDPRKQRSSVEAVFTGGNNQSGKVLPEIMIIVI